MGLQPNDVLIDDDDASAATPVVDGQPMGRGYEERDYNLYPVEMFAPPSEIDMIPESEWSDRIKEKEATKSRLSDLRMRALNGNFIPSLNQGNVGYCWSHSSAHSAIMVRAKANIPYVPLSAFSVAAIIKKGANQGGWCGLSAQFMREHGIAPQSKWPQGERSVKQYDTADMRAEMAKYKIIEDFVDLTRNVYDQNLTFKQLISQLLQNNPCPVDFNWWGHSVCALDAVEVEPGSFGIRIWNSWGDGWGDKGLGVLRGNKAIPDGALSIRVMAA